MSDIKCLLSNAQVVVIRPLQLDDVPSIDAMHDRMSKDSLYYRFFTPCKPSYDALRDQVQLTNSRGAGFVAVLQVSPQKTVGVAFYVLSPGDSHVAEPAILIEDGFQGLGLGKVMTECLVCEAQAHSIDYFQSHVLPENRRALQLLENSGLPMERHYRDGLMEVRQKLSSEQYIWNAELEALPASIRAVRA